MKRIHKNIISFIVAVCLLSAGLCACSSEDTKEKEAETSPIDYVSEKIPDKGDSFSKEEKEEIKTGIMGWASGFLIVDSSIEEEEKMVIDTTLYSSIASDEDREKLQKDREKLYTNAEVTVTSVDTKIKDAYKVEYQGSTLGRVSCTIKMEGTRNGKEFKRNYTVKMIINCDDAVSIYEIEKISWKS
ncbi:hypothetical protein [Sellimonas sp.]|uniref:hypothetical protein n=1 Tax=Sellimonas sp. TaxID=2021466 RepID=UPI000B39B012|nr:hypothetical protein [Sellimonas sp.]OUP63749.1 hypothetical protein B5F13_09870 [Drancourtella sp. An177]